MVFVIYFYKNARENNQNNSDTKTLASNLPPPGIPPIRFTPTGLRKNKRPTNHFALFYPDDLIVEEYRESGDGMTVTFEDKSGEKSFQIFVFPYIGNQISKQRFEMDVPSKVMDEPVEVVIDSINATAFWSRNDIMGEVREVWFINKGFLYEVTTYRELDDWLANIMKTWIFF